MKRIFYLFALSLLILASCSTDTPPLDTSILLKKVITSGIGPPNSTINITYDGNKIKSYLSSDRYITKFTYTGDVISKSEYFDILPDPYAVNEKDTILGSTNEYYYADGKLATEILKFSKKSINTKIEYIYNTDGTVISKEQDIDAVTGAVIDTNKYSLGKLTYKGGNLIAEEYSSYINGVVVPESVNSNIYDYDTKYNPFNNILGYNLLIGNTQASLNNWVKNSNRHGGNNYYNTLNYTYNSKGFPTLINQSGYIIKYFY